MARARRLLVSRLRAGAGKRYEAALGRSADLAAAAFDDPLAGTDTDAFQAVENELDTIAGEEIELDAQAQGAEEDDGAVEEAELRLLLRKAAALAQLNDHFAQAQAELSTQRAAALAAWSAIDDPYS